MPVRLTVVMVQSPPPNAPLNRPLASESIVGELIAAAGIDLVLVGRPESILPSSTDRMTLAAISGDMVVLDWQSPKSMCQALWEIGIGGYRAAHALDPDAATERAADGVPTSDLGRAGQNAERRIYAFDLRQFSSVVSLRDALQRLYSERQIKTVSLGGIFTPVKPRPNQPSENQSVPNTPALNTSALSMPLSNSSGPIMPSGPIAPPSNESAPKADSPSDSLDDLVDQLDAFDQS